MSYSHHVQTDRRLVILQTLNRDPGGSHNDHVLQADLGDWGHRITADALRTELAWLAEQGLVEVEHVGPNAEYHVASITDRGQEVAAGRARVPGVRKPRPSERR